MRYFYFFFFKREKKKERDISMQVGQTETKCLVLGFLSFFFFPFLE